MSIIVTPHLVHLTYEAALKSFWRRDALRKFLRQSHVSENFLSTWAPEESKREFLNRIFSALQRADKGKAVIIEMAFSLAEQTSFPDLREWEDSRVKLEDATRSVYELKTFIIKQKEKNQSKKEREIIKAMAQEEQKTIRKNRANIQKIKQNFEEITSEIGTVEGGYKFEKWFYSLLDFSEIDFRRSYMTKGRQVDGSVTLDGTTYLVELKFTKNQTGSPEIDTLKSKVESKADNTMGIFVSMAGYSSVAINEASGKKSTLLLLDFSHIYLILNEILSFSDVVKRVRRHASQTGEAYLSADKFSG